ncbi:GTPase [Actibacterium lipolyticum]|uniref:Dynamin family protein n=1 Tax=Actibacterium lipolyticum TaxID=1524263 RepID=A0A238L878_9RHOB|nr:GTPase [Actibacterium lipolyticum]SMX51284.1 Dynamin family protein [Actibacterium lipolyticum]
MTNKKTRPEAPAEAAPRARKPRIMVAGEFSSGKTQLINGLLGATVLPSNVTSTSLPPIWIVGEDVSSFRLGTDGEKQQIETLDGVSVTDTSFCLLSNPAPILEHFDVIDTPGNSDPNIPPECWERMLEYADVVIWCTNAVQAWRQSEKSVWNEMPEHLTENSTILITHADRMPDERSTQKVMRRVKRDAEPFFSHFLMGSLLNQEDLAAISDHLIELSASLKDCPGAEQPHVDAARLEGKAKKPQGVSIQPRRVKSNKASGSVADEAPVVVADEAPVAVVEEAPVVVTDEAPEPMVLEADMQVDDLDTSGIIKLFKMDDGQPAPAPAPAPTPAEASSESTEEIDLFNLFNEQVEGDEGDAQEPEISTLVQKSIETPSDAGPTRKMWERITWRQDLSDPATLSACVDALIEEVDSLLQSTADDDEMSDEFRPENFLRLRNAAGGKEQ